MKAFLKNYRQSPRKVRMLANLIKGKTLVDAQTSLAHTARKAGLGLEKLLASALANAKNEDASLNESNVTIKSVRVDKGMVMKRFRARAFGRAFPVRKRTSNITLELGIAEAKATPVKEAKTEKKSNESTPKP